MKSSALRTELTPDRPMTVLTRPFAAAKRRAETIHRRDLREAALTGLIGGLVGTIVMTGFQSAWGKIAEKLKEPDRGKQQPRGEQKEDATMKAAAKIAGLFGQELTHEQKKKLGPVIHYSFGTMQGAVYATGLKLAGSRGGLLPALAFGTGLFIVADELTVPALGLSRGATEAPLSAHIYGLASHVVYGLSNEAARQGATLGFRLLA